MTDIVERLRECMRPAGYAMTIANVETLQEAAAEIERLRAIEDAAIDAASYFYLGGCGEEDFDPQHMHDLMVKLGRALEPKP